MWNPVQVNPRFIDGFVLTEQDDKGRRKESFKYPAATRDWDQFPLAGGLCFLSLLEEVRK